MRASGRRGLSIGRAKQKRELVRLRRLQRLLRQVMEAGKILLLADEETNTALIQLSGARGVR